MTRVAREDTPWCVHTMWMKTADKARLVPTKWRNFLIYQLLYHEKDNNVFNGGDADDSMQPITRPELKLNDPSISKDKG